jgi:hypothetical protein
LLGNFLFDWIVVDLQLHDGLVLFESIPDELTASILDNVVANAQGAQCSEGAPDHSQELRSNVLARELAFRNVEVLDTECYSVLTECLRDFDNSRLDGIALQIKGLQESVASETLSYHFSGFLVQVAEAEVEELEGLVAAQELMDNLELLPITGQRVLRKPQFAHFIIGLQTGEQVMETFSCNHIGMEVEFPEGHPLLGVQNTEV